MILERCRHPIPVNTKAITVAQEEIEGRTVTVGARDIGWKQFVVRLIEVLRWPAAAIAIAVIFREPLTLLISAVAGLG